MVVAHAIAASVANALVAGAIDAVRVEDNIRGKCNLGGSAVGAAEEKGSEDEEGEEGFEHCG